MVTHNAFLDGKPLDLGTEAPEASTADFRGRIQVHTGKAEGQWVGETLLRLSAYGGTWRRVPWRWLRNTYFRYPWYKRLALRWRKAPPPLFDEEPMVTWYLGRGRPAETILIGLKNLFDHRLVERYVAADGEVFFSPAPALFRCVVGETQPMSVGRHLFPFDDPPPAADSSK